MTVIRFRFDMNDRGLTWEDYETIEMAQDGVVKMHRLRPLVARFMTGENGQYLPHKQAMDVLGKLPLDEVKDVFQKFTQAVQDAAVPNASGGSLPPPSEADTPVSPSPDGSQP